MPLTYYETIQLNDCIPLHWEICGSSNKATKCVMVKLSGNDSFKLSRSSNLSPRSSIFFVYEIFRRRRDLDQENKAAQL